MSVRHLDALFRPASIAVLGASGRPGSLGAVVWRNLVAAGFAGPVWPVNPRPQEIDGRRVFASVAALPAAPELAVICSPAATVPGLVAELGARGTRAAIVITAGLRDERDEDGRTLQQAALDAARPHVLRILGPNCVGAVVPAARLNASFAPGFAEPGSLAFLTQSGALATAMLDWAAQRGIGFSHFVSLGDSADVDFGDLLDYLGSDADTRAILMYVESVQDARKFMSAARAAARNKPVIVVKAGRAPAGARAAASHTGALAGSDAVFDAAVRRAGLLRVGTLEELFDAAETLSRPQAWCGERLALLTNGGGAGVLAADAVALQGGQLAALDAGTLAALDAVLPANWSHGNPVDIIGDAPAPRYRAALDVLLAAPEVDGVLFLHAPTAIVPAGEIAATCLDGLQSRTKPVLACWLGGQAVAAGRDAFAAAGLPCYPTPERGVAAWQQLARYHAAQAALLQLPDARPAFRVDRDAVQAILRDARQEGREWLDGAAALQLLAGYGVPVVPSRFCRDAQDVHDAACDLGFPVALKVVARQIVHKSDVGGVVLGIANGEALQEALVAMRQRIAVQAPEARIAGFVVQAMARRPGARELIAGLAADPVFGPVLLFGEGGTAVELHGGHAIGLPPLNAALARDLVARTSAARVLAAHRGRAAANEGAVVDTLLKLSQLACDLDDVLEVDINPLLADADGVLAVDARVRLRTASAPPRRRLALRPYPQDQASVVDLGGRALQVRPIRPEDGAALRAFYAGASPHDLRLRFFLSRREVPASELARYCQIDYDREMTFVALAGDGTMAGEVRAICDPDNTVAEFAIQVAPPWQNSGLGTALLRRMIDYLRSRGTGALVGETLRENACMLALARRLGFTVRHDAALDLAHLRLDLAADARA